MDPKPTPKKSGPRSALNPELLAAALVELQGNLAGAAKRFGVARSSVKQFVDKRPNLVQICTDAREGMLDHAESSLYRSVIAGEAWAVCFFLKTQGRSRGYDENETLREMQKEIRSLREIILGVAANRSTGGAKGTPRTGGDTADRPPPA